MKVGELSYDTRSREPNTIIVATLDASIGQTNKHSVCQVTLWDVITGVFFFYHGPQPVLLCACANKVSN